MGYFAHHHQAYAAPSRGKKQNGQLELDWIPHRPVPCRLCEVKNCENQDQIDASGNQVSFPANCVLLTKHDLVNWQCWRLASNLLLSPLRMHVTLNPVSQALNCTSVLKSNSVFSWRRTDYTVTGDSMDVYHLMEINRHDSHTPVQQPLWECELSVSVEYWALASSQLFLINCWPESDWPVHPWWSWCCSRLHWNNSDLWSFDWEFWMI